MSQNQSVRVATKLRDSTLDSSNSLSVACKLPHGLIITVDGVSVTLNGANAANTVGGYGFTNVNESFWGKWCKLYRDNVALQKGLIFAQPKLANARAQAKEQSAIRSGLEQLDPQKITGVKPSAQPGSKEEDAELQEAAERAESEEL